MDNTQDLPGVIRFADYYFRVGLGPESNLTAKRVVDKIEETPEPVEQVKEILDPTRKIKEIHPLHYRYEPETIFRYPKEDYGDNCKFPVYTPLITTEADGSKSYGVCVTTYVSPTKEQSKQLDDLITDWRNRNLVESDYEFAQHVQTQLAVQKERLLKLKMGIEDSSRESAALAEENIGLLEELMSPLRHSVLAQLDNIYLPTCIGILSRWPWYDFLKDWLCIMLKNCRDGEFERFAFERCVINLLYEVPLPPPGKLEVGISIADYVLYIHRPPVNTIPLVKNYSCYPLFRCMSLEHIVTLFELLMMDVKVILLSDHPSMLTLSCEIICGWLYPFYWHHILIPVLPKRLLNYLQAPVPFLVGIQKKSFPEWRTAEWRPPDAAVVDIDNDVLDFTPVKVKLPGRERRKLISILEKYSGKSNTATSPAYKNLGVPETMKCTFPQDKHFIKSANSIIGKRKIRDIPKLLYSIYSNPFLHEKSRAATGHLRAPSAKTAGSSTLNSNSIAASSSMIIQSFDNVNMASNTQLDSVPSVAAPPITKLSINTSLNENPSLALSVGSFVATPRASVLESSVPSETPSEESVYSLQSVMKNPQKFAKAANDEPKQEVPPTPSSAFFSKPNWWSRSTTNTQSVAASPSVDEKPRISIFDKFMAISSKKSSILQTPAQQTPSISIENSNGILNSKAVPTNEPLTISPIEAPLIYKEGHIFHELILNEVREVDIDEEDENDDDYADRFTTNSDSSDGNSRSDVSQVADPRYGPPKRVPGQQRGASKELFRRRTDPSTHAKAERIKKPNRLECHLCATEYNPKSCTVLMCQSCHLICHQDCVVLTDASPCPLTFQDEKIAVAFFKVLTSLLKNYRHNLNFPDEKKLGSNNSDTGTDNFFKKAEFLSEFDSETRAFMSIVVETQAFAQFVLDRIERPETDYQVLFFDESIKQKLNRSKMRFTKETTPFLNEQTYQISSTIMAMPVNQDDLPTDNYYSVDVFEWKSVYEVQPRTPQQLLTEADLQMMRSHTNELVNRARIAAMKGKQDFTKWMKLKWKGFQKTDASEVPVFSSDDQRRDLLEERLEQVTRVIDMYEASHLSSQRYSQVERAIHNLHEQNLILLKACDEEQLVDSSDQEELQRIISRLIRVITIYEQHLENIPQSRKEILPQTPPALPPRRQPSNVSDWQEQLSEPSIERVPTHERVSEWKENRVSDWVSDLPIRESQVSNTSTDEEMLDDDELNSLREIGRPTITLNSHLDRSNVSLQIDLDDDFGRPTVTLKDTGEKDSASLKVLRSRTPSALPDCELVDSIDELSRPTVNSRDVLVKRSEGTLYEGQEFELQVNFGSKYPMEAPEPVPVHPHIYSNGHICLSILYDHWSPALTVESVCLSIQSMLSSCTVLEPPPDDARYVRTAPQSSKKSKWNFHDDSV
ncbi:hypothetical protein HDV04_003037 [Boothiomyces sp. JEL0838]|nr:hypothetical protein HDV04_003037 [Boothiomyces sp. JEL0838]